MTGEKKSKLYTRGYSLAAKWVIEYGFEAAQESMRGFTDEARDFGSYNDFDAGLEAYFTENPA